MQVFWTNTGAFRHVEYETEADLEKAILEVQRALFGHGRHYLDIKRRIGGAGQIRNVPDGYLLDFTGPKPRLYVVENELQSHDPLRHIAVQILQFSLSFESDPLRVKRILLQAIESQADVSTASQIYAANHGFRNLDHLLEYLVTESPFSALVIIDAMPEELEDVLSKKFGFRVEVLELSRYENEKGERVYHFEPFLEDIVGEAVGQAVTAPAARLLPEEIDTVVVPAREEGFQETFIGENCWYKVRIHGSVRPQIKYVAAYRIAPISAITHIAGVQAIEPYRDTSKYILYFAEPAKEIGPIPLVKGGVVKALQNLRYTTRERLLKAKNLDEVFTSDKAATGAQDNQT